MRDLPDAWTAPAPEWVTMAPGIRWLLQRPDGMVKTIVASDVAAVMSRVYAGRAGLEALGLDPDLDTGGAMELERLAGYTAVLTACLYAQRCLLGWEGIEHPATGETLDYQDPANVKAVLLNGPPPDGQPLLSPFLAWVEGPRRPMAAEGTRLRRLAKDFWTGGAERCMACADAGDRCVKGASEGGELCPRLELAPTTPEGIVAWSIATTTSGLWMRAGMSATLTGLDYRGALLAFETEVGQAADTPDLGAAFAAFRSIEAGRMEAESAKAEANAEGA